MPDDASAAGEPIALAGRVRSALESGDLDAIRDLLGPSARWGAPEGPGAADCRNRDQVIAWWASARAAGARAVVTEVTAGPGTLLVGLDVSGTPAAREQPMRALSNGVVPVAGHAWLTRRRARCRAGVLLFWGAVRRRVLCLILRLYLASKRACGPDSLHPSLRRGQGLLTLTNGFHPRQRRALPLAAGAPTAVMRPVRSPPGRGEGARQRCQRPRGRGG